MVAVSMVKVVHTALLKPINTESETTSANGVAQRRQEQVALIVQQEDTKNNFFILCPLLISVLLISITNNSNKGFIMGMGYSGININTVSDDTLIKVCSVEFEAFKQALEKAGLDIDCQGVGYSIEHGDFSELEDSMPDGTENVEELIKAVEDTLDALTTKFCEVTDLQLSFAVHDSDEEGSRYDDVNGHYWELHGVYQLTPVAKQFKEQFGDSSIENTSFVQYG